jgi:hypothetical protein
LKLYNPWGTQSKIRVITTNNGTKDIGGDIITIKIKKREVVTLENINN